MALEPGAAVGSFTATRHLDDCDHAHPGTGVGECIEQRHYDAGTGCYWLSIERSDPVIHISHEILKRWMAGDHLPEVTVTPLERWNPRTPVPGTVIRIQGRNRTVIYRLTERLNAHTWLAEWPD
jgi:hypothetical protein